MGSQLICLVQSPRLDHIFPVATGMRDYLSLHTKDFLCLPGCGLLFSHMVQGEGSVYT